MDEYYVKKTFNTPEIYFDLQEGILKINGRSIPEDPVDFYENLITKIHEYFKNPKEHTEVDIRLEYINSGSAKYILEIMRIFKRYYDKGHHSTINWYYEEDDEAIYELGQHYQSSIGIPIKLIDYY